MAERRQPSQHVDLRTNEQVPTPDEVPSLVTAYGANVVHGVVVVNSNTEGPFQDVVGDIDISGALPAFPPGVELQGWCLLWVIQKSRLAAFRIS
eukprot:CAMPEP_0204289564 /NCGR_PEP_ID=MMETSP0468-20130131/58865_1 /ASSEMBLY_ACC=CAM_ASM_000383 /TAXON_ID=2969 /ORGANISM="Oxyrrhis marina" /LENGTH=93 /DNA_ID=CAMNT_0051267729 /DNA_START=344 /DNA_END=621 /DNA_ORIENTATION=+